MTERPAGPDPSPPPSDDPAVLANLSRQFAEMAEYVSCYLSARIEQGKLSAREALWRVVGWFAALLLVCGVLITSVVFTFQGAALGVARLAGDRLWLGYLATGLFFLILTGGAIRLLRFRSAKKSLRERSEDYERTLEGQRARFGRDLEDRAAE